jgi:hypothetical protein
MPLHLHPVETALPPEPASEAVEPVYFVLQRQNGQWSPAAKIMAVCSAEAEAESVAHHLKIQHPQQFFGVAALRSEARAVANPVEIVRVPPTIVEPSNDAH